MKWNHSISTCQMSINYDRRKNTTLLPFLLQVLVGDSVNHVLRSPAPAPQNEADSLRRPAPFYWNIIAGQVDWLSIRGHLINNQHYFFVVILTKTIYRHRINIIIRGYSSRFFICSWWRIFLFTFFKSPTWRTIGYVWEKYVGYEWKK